MKLTEKQFEEKIERKIIVEEKIERRVIEKSLEERVELLELKFAEYIFLSDEQIKEIRDLIQLYYDIYGNKRIWSILREKCKFSKLERVPRYKYNMIKKILFDFVGESTESRPINKQNLLLGDNGDEVLEHKKQATKKKKKYHKKRVDTSGCPSILSF
ncbi:MAG: hypothetical protein ACFFCD_10600 [Promethearchaeota archaeon]